MIKAKIIADSLNSYTGDRLTSWVLTYPRFIHSEIMTHRVFSRNAASSRAIPSSKLIQMIEEDPAIPVYWGEDQKGMQAKRSLDNSKEIEALKLWVKARDEAISIAKQLQELGLHKQIANRILEPWMHMTVILSGTEYENFFALRAHKDAQPEFQMLAYLMLEKYNSNEPKRLKSGEWHIPFGDNLDSSISDDLKIEIATARCARVSYVNFEGKDDYEADFKLHDRLLKAGHYSPFEHCARADETHSSGNFKGFIQYRHFLNYSERSDDRVVKHKI